MATSSGSQELELADASVDIIVSNCVLNLAPDKAAVLREAWRVLSQAGNYIFPMFILTGACLLRSPRSRPIR